MHGVDLKLTHLYTLQSVVAGPAPTTLARTISSRGKQKQNKKIINIF